MKLFKKIILSALLLCGILGCIYGQNCQIPVLRTINNFSTQGFTISWDDFNQTNVSWEVEIGQKGFVRQFIPNYSDINQLQFVFDQLDSGSTYEFYIRSRCDVDETSDWNGPYFGSTVIENGGDCDLAIEIEDNNCPDLTSFLIQVNEGPFDVIGQDLRLRDLSLLIDHSWPPDLRILLESPAGTEILLSEFNGNAIDDYGDSSNDSCQLLAVFDDNACLSIDQAIPPLVGNYRPQQSLNSNYFGERANGVWRLKVCDRARGDLGILKHLQIDFESQSCEKPSLFQLVDIEADNALISWESHSMCESISIEYGELGAPEEEIFKDIIPCSNGTLRITNLSPSTTYSLRAFSSCTNGLDSPAFCEIGFTTACNNSNILTDFDSNSLCEDDCDLDCALGAVWSNASSNTQAWRVWEGKTPTDNTGPVGDINTTGKYLFLNNSAECSSNQRNILESTCLEIIENVDCHVSFYYHMFGNQQGTLSLEYSQEEGDWIEVWSVSGESGIDWEYVELALDIPTDFKLRFIGDQLPGRFRGDIALDHLKLIGISSTDFSVYYLDNDGDGFGGQDSLILRCSSQIPDGLSRNNLDCDDDALTTFPGAPEIMCNNVDDDCNGLVDDTDVVNIVYSVIEVVDASCQGLMDGMIDITYDTSLGYDFEWNNGAQTDDLINIGPGTYVCTITEPSGCLLVTDPIIVNANDVIVYNVNQNVSPSCIGVSNGLIELNVSGGVAPYEVLWNNGMSGQLISGIRNGVYSGTITDAMGCIQEIDSITVFAPQVLTAGTPVRRGASCYGASDGLVQLGISGGQVPYNIAWSSGETSSVVSQLTAGSYQVTITDAIGCEVILEDIIISEPDSIRQRDVLISDVQCFGGNDGFIDVSLEGGTSPYAFFWSDGTFSEDLFNRPAGLYHLTVTDFNGCRIMIDSLEITQPEAVSIQLDNIEDVNCIGSDNGLIDVSAFGGTPPYAFNWNILDGVDDVGNQLENLSPGFYFLTVVDQLGCKSDVSQFEILNRNQSLNVSTIQLDSILCFDDANASVIAVVNNASPPLDFNWSSGVKDIKDVFSDTLSQLSTGTYNLTVTDADGCTGVSDSIFIETPSEIRVEDLTIVANICKGDNLASISLKVQGGTPGYNINWNSGLSGDSISNLVNGQYIATITDQNGCVVELNPLTVSSQSNLSADIFVSNASNLMGGSITINPVQGVEPYMISWDDSDILDGDFQPTDLEIGEYSFTITDALSCTFDSTLVVDFVSSHDDQIAEDKTVLIIPQPADDFAHLLFNFETNSPQVELYDISGRRLDIQTNTLSNQSIRLDLTTLKSTGIYTIIIRDADRVYVRKLLVI